MEGPKEKLYRAREHLRALRHEIDVFLYREPYGAAHEIDPENGDDIWRMEINSPPPMRLGVMVGDVVHNLRSCLDHLAWQLALMCTSSPRKTTEFPIFRDARTGPCHKGFDPDGAKKIRDLPGDAQKIIQSVQPYHGLTPLGDALWTLHRMAITDKHQIILAPLATSGVTIIPIDHTAPSGSIILGRVHDHGGILLRVPKASAHYLDKNDQPDFMFRIGTDIPGIGRRDVLTTLSLIDEAISHKLFPQFERFF
jgi:hypothetical protein